MNVEREQVIKQHVMSVARQKVSIILNRLGIDATMLIHPPSVEDGYAPVEVKFYDPVDHDALRKEIAEAMIGGITFAADGSKAVVDVAYDYNQVCSDTWAHLFRNRLSAAVVDLFNHLYITKLMIQETAPQYWEIEVCTKYEIDDDFFNDTFKPFIRSHLIPTQAAKRSDDRKSVIAFGIELE